MLPKKIRIAIVGLGFGTEFIPIYKAHPNAELYAICRRNKLELNNIGNHYNIKVRYSSFNELLQDPNIDAVHLNTPIHEHAHQSIAALQAGKHVACTVPMGLTIEELKSICAAERKSKKIYVMMETVIFSREFLFIKELYGKGELGRLQFLRSSHQQDMAGWPNYWLGFPPMLYSTHCVSPLLALISKTGEPGLVSSVVCHGSGRIDEQLIERYNSPFAVETATFKIEKSDVIAEVTRSLFNTARQYRESFDVIGSEKSFEWQQIASEDPILHTKSTITNPLTENEIPQRIKIPDYAHYLPEPIRQFTKPSSIQDEKHLSYLQGGGHGGSHPHLVHHFVMAILGENHNLPNAITSANWTASGICAHQSAMQGGIKIKIPTF